MTEIIDRKPEGKKNMTGKQAIIALIIFLAVGGVVYVINHNPNAKKDMVVMNVGGIEIIPGKTAVSEFLDAGYGLALYYAENTLDENEILEKESYVSMVALTKDGKSYASISVGNDTGKDAPLSQGIILSVAVTDIEESASAVTADRVAMKDLTEEKLFEMYGEPDTREADTNYGGTKLEWENKGYYFTVNISDDGKVARISSAEGHY